MSSFHRVLAAAACLAGIAPRIAISQHRGPIDIVPGDANVQGSLLSPYSRRYSILQFACEFDTVAPHVDGIYEDVLDRSGDTVFLHIQTWHRRNDQVVIDSMWLNSRTLAPLASQSHIGGFHDAWTFRHNSIAYRSSSLTGPQARPFDTTMDSPVFSAGEVTLLLTATPAIYAIGQTIRFRAVDLHQEAGEDPDGFEISAIDVVARDSTAHLRTPGAWAPLWAVMVYGDRTYWLDRRSHVPVAWEYPQYESVCRQRYILTTP